MSDVALLLYSILFMTSGCASVPLNTFIDAIADTLTFTLENYELIDTNLLFGVAIVAGGGVKRTIRIRITVEGLCNFQFGKARGGHQKPEKVYTKFSVDPEMGQLEVLAQYDLNDDFQSEIRRLRILCQSIFEKGFNENTTKINFRRTPKILFAPALWAFDNLPKRLTKPGKRLFNDGVRMKSSGSVRAEDEFQFRSVYEVCLRILVLHCYVPKKCFQWIVDYESREYVLTHQILYLQFMKQMLEKDLCTAGSIPLDANELDHMMGQKCSQVYVDIEEMEERTDLSQNKTLIDLLLEDVVVCGLQNYDEFFSQRYLGFILADEFQALGDALVKYDNETFINNAVHLMSVRVAAQILYLKTLCSSPPPDE